LEHPLNEETGTMSRQPASLTGGERLADLMAIGLVARAVPREAVQRVLAETQCASVRERALTAELVMYYTVCLALYMNQSSREVLRILLEMANGPREESLAIPVHSAITQARQRLGPAPFVRLAQAVLRPLSAKPAASAKSAQGGWYRGQRVVSLDGSTLDTVDTPCNEAAFGKHQQGRRACGFPKVRIVALTENASHAALAVNHGPYRRGETTLAQPLVDRLTAGMLCLADRNFCQYPLFARAMKLGADLLWRVRNDRRLKVIKRLADGSYLSELRPGKGRATPLPVRVIEYDVTCQKEDGGAHTERYRLVTTLCAPDQAPARELAALYPTRWEIEGAFEEFKTYLRGPRRLLRSRLPALVEQEVYALFIAHHVIRALLYDAALAHDEDPLRLSFTHGLRVVQRKLPLSGAFSPSPSRTGPCQAPGRSV
jgi:hypothetical protein